MLEKWSKAIPRADRALTIKDSVCEKHFSPEQVLSKHIVKRPDGTILYEEERKRKALVDGAVPHLFEGTCQGKQIPKYLSSRKGGRKTPRKRYSDSGDSRLAAPGISIDSIKKRLHPVVERYLHSLRFMTRKYCLFHQKLH